MKATGKCALCQGALAHEENVFIQALRNNDFICYRRAWVCTQCGAAWPIAVAADDGFFTTVNFPLWADGKRRETT